jgi:hypothetical protein
VSLCEQVQQNLTVRADLIAPRASQWV